MRAAFVTSAVNPQGYPAPDRPEIAFVGRSNVGKSSLLNAIVRQKIARASKTPGRTQQINFFDVEDREAAFRIADLPGYGFARVPTEVQQTWPSMIEDYLQNRPCLRALLLLVDLRHEAQPADHEAVAWLRSLRRPIDLFLLGTKADRLAKAHQKVALIRLSDALGVPRERTGLASAASGVGLDAIRKTLLEIAQVS
ncbi:MAG: YihA family ribosome biogenesis GTP-binding protein [Deltaproteobacteria bacterium]|nr:YihA family ribosome biogenesis GTP-binding protein [Deltaproteobacteria bacterium]